MYTKRSEGAESLHRSHPGLHAAAEEALCSCCCEWPQEQEGGPGQAITSHRKPLGCLCLMLHPRSSSQRRIREPVRVHFGGGTLRPCRLPGPAHCCGLIGPSQVLGWGLGGSLRHSSCQPLIETMAMGLQTSLLPGPCPGLVIQKLRHGKGPCGSLFSGTSPGRRTSMCGGTLVCFPKTSCRGSSPTTAAGRAHAVAGGTLRPACQLCAAGAGVTALTAPLLAAGGVPFSAAPPHLIQCQAGAPQPAQAKSNRQQRVRLACLPTSTAQHIRLCPHPWNSAGDSWGY